MSSPSLHRYMQKEDALTGGRPSYGLFGERKLSLLCEGIGFSPRVHKDAIRVFRRLSRSWGDRTLGPIPAWPTDLTDDATPFEFSIAFDGMAPQLRMLVEAQQAPMTLQSSWVAGLGLNHDLNHLPTVDFARFNLVRDLFAPAEDATARFSIWHAAVLDSNAGTAYKVYLNPEVRGPEAAADIVMDALARLGMESARNFLRARMVRVNDGLRILYFSLDLSANPEARVKVYFAHPHIKAEEIEPALEGAHNYVPGEAARWIQQLLGNSGPFDRRPILTCLSFTASAGRPLGTLHVPVRSYTRDDQSSIERTCDFLSPRDGQALTRALSLVADRPLTAGPGLLTYVSLRRMGRGLSTTIYVSPEAFTISSSGESCPPRRP